eukprot:895055-Pelagomonas_calceolata.AAC.1
MLFTAIADHASMLNNTSALALQSAIGERAPGAFSFQLFLIHGFKEGACALSKAFFCQLNPAGACCKLLSFCQGEGLCRFSCESAVSQLVGGL